jgi:hypothetical protein
LAALLVSTVMLVVVAACERDPGRDVRPMTPPLESSSQPLITSDTLSLDEVRKSQAAAVAQRVADTEITVTYSRPVARGRPLFGELVPYDEVWNPGADRATAIMFTRDVEINGQPLRAGKYSLWAIPRPESWTVIFSRAAEVYHTPYPGEADDALRFDVNVENGSHTEVLTFDFASVEGKDALLQLRWGTTVVPLSIRVP